MEGNIYSSPDSDLVKEEEDVVTLASRWRRLFGSIIDTSILLLFVVPIMYFSGGLTAPMEGEQNTFAYTLALGLVSLVIFVVINGYLLKKDGQTVGKKLLGIRLVTLTDDIPTVKELLVRYAVFFLPGQVPVIGQIFGFLNVVFIFGSQRRCLHDHAAKTKVIKC